MNSPYSNLPAKAFWKLGVSRQASGADDRVVGTRVKLGQVEQLGLPAAGGDADVRQLGSG